MTNLWQTTKHNNTSEKSSRFGRFLKSTTQIWQFKFKRLNGTDINKQWHNIFYMVPWSSLDCSMLGSNIKSLCKWDIRTPEPYAMYTIRISKRYIYSWGHKLYVPFRLSHLTCTTASVLNSAAAILHSHIFRVNWTWLTRITRTFKLSTWIQSWARYNTNNNKMIKLQ